METKIWNREQNSKPLSPNMSSPKFLIGDPQSQLFFSLI